MKKSKKKKGTRSGERENVGGRLRVPCSTDIRGKEERKRRCVYPQEKRC